MEKDNGGPAFPTPDVIFPEAAGGGSKRGQAGLSTLDYFAGQALAGLMGQITDAAKSPPELVATTCYALARAMLKERGRDE